MESAVISIKTKTDSEVTYDDDTSPNKSTKLPQLLVQVKIFYEFPWLFDRKDGRGPTSSFDIQKFR